MHVFMMFMCVCVMSVRKISNTFPQCVRRLSPALTLAGSADRSLNQLSVNVAACLSSTEEFLIHSRVKTLRSETLHPHREELLV